MRLLLWLNGSVEDLMRQGAILQADGQQLLAKLTVLLESAQITLATPEERSRGLLSTEAGRRMKAELRAFVELHDSHQF